MQRSEEFYKKQFGPWYDQLKKIVYSERFDRLLDELKDLDHDDSMRPKRSVIFAPFRYFHPSKLKLVILAERPPLIKNYNGLALADNPESFSLTHRSAAIMQKIEETFYDGMLLNYDYSLENLAKQGVLLLNASLTTGSEMVAHEEFWEPFIFVLIKNIIRNNKDVPFILFGERTFKFNVVLAEANAKFIKVSNPMIGAVDKWNFPIKEIDKLTKHKINW